MASSSIKYGLLAAPVMRVWDSSVADVNAMNDEPLGGDWLKNSSESVSMTLNLHAHPGSAYTVP